MTSSGTLTGAFVAQAVNTIFAGPSSGGAATPTFRALTAADIPAVTKLTYVEVSATASTPPFNTGSFTVVTGMTTTPPAGTYQVSFSSSGTGSVSSGVYTYAIFSGVTQITHSTRTVGGNTSQKALVTQGVVVADGVSAVSIQWMQTSGAGQFTMNQRSMFLLRIG